MAFVRHFTFVMGLSEGVYSMRKHLGQVLHPPGIHELVKSGARPESEFAVSCGDDEIFDDEISRIRPDLFELLTC